VGYSDLKSAKDIGAKFERTRCCRNILLLYEVNLASPLLLIVRQAVKLTMRSARRTMQHMVLHSSTLFKYAQSTKGQLPPRLASSVDNPIREPYNPLSDTYIGAFVRRKSKGPSQFRAHGWVPCCMMIVHRGSSSPLCVQEQQRGKKRVSKRESFQGR